MSIHDYIIDHQGFDWTKLLENWHWLLPERFVIWIMNRFGDLFLVQDDGTVLHLDIGVGTLTKVAESRDEFTARIDEPDNAAEWLMIPLVERLVAADMVLTDGQCYGFRLPPVLGGKYEIENVAVLPVHDYLNGYGSIHHQMIDVPNGGQVIIDIVNRPKAR